MRRVVVTGLGMVSPLASGVEETWSRLIAGENAAGTITRFDADNFATNYACEIPFGDGTNGTFNPSNWMEPKDRRKVDDFILYGIAAADMAVADSGWAPTNEEDLYRTGVMIGSGVGGLSTIADTSIGKVLNVTSGVGTSIKDAFSCVSDYAAKLTGKKIKINHIKWPKGISMIERRNFIGDASELKKTTKWLPYVSFEEGVEIIVEEFWREKSC